MNNRLYKIDSFVLDTQKRCFFHEDRLIQLSSRAYEILYYLIEKKGEIVEKEDLLTRVWTDSFVEESNLAVHISALRRVLQEKKGESKYIKTISGRGYSFVASVTEIVSTEEIVAIREGVAKTQTKEVSRNASLAILPFTFEVNKKENEYLADGITRSLINDLSQIPDLKVLAYGAVREYKNSEFELQEIGFLLDVDKILTGHISEYKAKWEIVAELINVRDKRCIWGTSQTFDSEDVFKVKNEISVIIAEKLKPQLNVNKEREIIKSKEINAEAQKLYFRGKFILESRGTRKNPRDILYQALKFFRDAVKKEPNYALAYVGIGSVYVSLHNHNLLEKEEAYPEAKKALQKALNTNDKLSDVYVLKGSIEIMFEMKFAEANESLDKAIELNPNNPDAYHWKSLICMCFERIDDSLYFQNKAIELDPTSLRYSESLIRAFYFAGEYNKTITQAEEIIEFDENSLASCFFLACAYAELGFFDEALNYIDKAIIIRPVQEMYLNKGYIQALSGNTKEATDILKNNFNNLNIKGKIDYTNSAAICVLINEINLAFVQVETDLFFIRADPRFKNLRKDERFAQLLEKMKLN
jgi:adenylate cyclase